MLMKVFRANIGSLTLTFTATYTDPLAPPCGLCSYILASKYLYRVLEDNYINTLQDLRFPFVKVSAPPLKPPVWLCGRQ